MSTKKIHYTSGIIIALFAGFHLLNHLCGIYGADTHIEVMRYLRIGYRSFFVETLLLLSVMIQVISGVGLFREKRKTASSFFEKLQIWSGLYLAFFFVMHTGAVMTGRFVLSLDTNYYFGVAGLNSFPVNLFFIPYYGLAILAFWGHIAAIHSMKMKKTIFNLSPDLQAKAILLMGVLFVITILYALTNQFRGVEIPETYHILTGK